MTVLKIAGYLELQPRFLPGYVQLPNLGGAQTALAGKPGYGREVEKPMGRRGSVEGVEHRDAFSHLTKHAPLRNEQEMKKLQLRHEGSSFLGPLLWALPRLKGKNMFRNCFSGWGGGQACGMLHWKSYFSLLSFRSLLNMQMLVIPKLPKKC